MKLAPIGLVTASSLKKSGVTFPRKEDALGFVGVVAPEGLHETIRREVERRSHMFEISDYVKVKVEHDADGVVHSVTIVAPEPGTWKKGTCLVCREEHAAVGAFCELCNLAAQKRMGIL
jgi:hypothetical protein